MKKNILLLAFSIISTYSFCQSNLNKVLEKYKDSLNNYGFVCLTDNGDTMKSASVGFEFHNSKMKPTNRFCIGSLTKMYTATLILKLQEKGLLHLSDTLGKYNINHPFINNSISIRQLLNHTSGITDFTKGGLVNKALLMPFDDYSDKYIFSLIDTVDFNSGTKHRYSNSNYFLLRKIIEIATDQPFESVLEEYLIRPLNLKNTYSYYSSKIDQLAHPIIDGQDLHNYPTFGLNMISRGIGNIVSDVYDVNKFIRELLIEKTILNEQSLNEMTNIKTIGNTNVGLGLYEEIFSNKTWIGHTGRQISYISYAFINRETNKSLIVLTNNANDKFIDKIVEELSNLDE